MKVDAPSFSRFESSPHLIGTDKGELLFRVFLPYSDLGWANPKKLAQERREFAQGNIPQDGILDEDWYAKDEGGKLLPGNIVEDAYWAVFHCLPIWRLNSIKQLAMLAFATEDEKNVYAKGLEFPQTRLEHSILTARITEIMLRNNGFSERDINLGTISALIHDIATPAFGDPTMEIDPDALSEETALERLLQEHDTTPLEQFGFNKQLVLDIVRGRGTIGKILDIADKIAYTAVDLHNYAGNPYMPAMHGLLDSTIEPIKSMLRASPKWANIFQDVSITENGEPYFKNPGSLSVFLELRAIMHKALYLNPHCRGFDMMYKMLLSPLYTRDPNPDFPLNSQNLILYTDNELSNIINDFWQLVSEKGGFTAPLGVLPDYEVATGNRTADLIIDDLAEKGKLVIGSETIRRFNPAMDFLTVDLTDQQIKPYKDVNPEHAYYLEKMVDHCNKTVVYYWPETEIRETSKETRLKPIIAEIVNRIRQKNGGRLPHYQLY